MDEQHERDKARFQAALSTRQFEIGLFWTRALYFWGFISAAFVAVGALKNEAPGLSLLIAGFGFVCSFSWTLANRGSKFWQEQWESKIESIEDSVTGQLFKRFEPVQPKGYWGASPFSVTRLTVAVSDYVTLVWFFVICRQGWILFSDKPILPSPAQKWIAVPLVVAPVIYGGIMLRGGRRSGLVKK